MLDYEILVYKVEYHEIGAVSGCWFNCEFNTEENAINFIKENRIEWSGYRLIKMQTAIIDF